MSGNTLRKNEPGPGGRIPRLTRQAIAEIMRRWKDGEMQKDLAVAYGVSISTMSRIITREVRRAR